MSRDPYKVLEVSRTASADELQAAFRRLAKRYHPDVNPGDKTAEDTFKQITAAYELLSDPKTRARFDRGEIDASGQPRMDKNFEWAFEGGKPGAAGANFEDIGDIFSEFFGGYRSARERSAKAAGGRTAGIRGADVQYTMEAEFLDAANGARRRVTMHDGRILDIQIPKGLKDGQTLRLKGQGLPGAMGGEPGDALVEVKVKPHPVFKRDGDDIRIDLPISLTEAVQGGMVEVPTISGPVSVQVPAGSNTGRVLRLRGKGASGEGDQLITLRIVLPKTVDRELEAFVQRWTFADYNPRKG